MKLCIVQPSTSAFSETFLDIQAVLLPFETTVVHLNPETGVPTVNSQPVFSQSMVSRLASKISAKLLKKGNDWEQTAALAKIFRTKADIVLAQYGPTGVKCLGAAQLAGVPLVTHFHGYDVSKYSVLEEYSDSYKELFLESHRQVAVSRKMVDDLVSIGASRTNIYLNPCGVDTSRFQGADPANNPPVAVSVVRFVEKKAPYLTILSFSFVLKILPSAKLIMLGGGQLLGVCQDLAKALNIDKSIEFRGECSHSEVKESMMNARCFVQHSIKASDGDCEGTPVGVLEASSIGLPVISTMHAGISDAVVHEETGFLVKEKDVKGMAENIILLLSDPMLAKSMGAKGRVHVSEKFSMDKSIKVLARILSDNLYDPN